MNLARGLAKREAQGRPIRVGLIGAGKFGTMILAQLRLMLGVRLCVLADLDPARARRAAVEAGWDGDAFASAANAGAANDLARAGRVALVESGIVATDCELDVLIEGHPEAGSEWYAGRSYRDAPEVDGLVLVKAPELRVGDLCRVRVERALDYDLLASLAPPV